MCTIDGEFQTVIKKGINERSVCKKCKSMKAEIALRIDDFYCEKCFLEYLSHKFRSTIGKSKMIKRNDRVLVGFSGNLSSTCLLSLIRYGENLDTTKKIPFQYSVLFIDDSVSKSATLLPSIQRIVQSFGVPSYYTFLQEVLRPAGEILVKSFETDNLVDEIEKYYAECEDLVDKLNNFLAQMVSFTSQRDVISILKNKLLARSAKCLGLKKLFLASNATDLALNMLSAIALGRGAHSADLVNFNSSVFDVEVYKPLRELSEDELSHYSRLNSLEILLSKDKTDPHKKELDIYTCTKNFISHLDANFISTVPTIVRTGSKLASCTKLKRDGNDKSSVISSYLKCSFCGLIVDTNSNAVHAVDISRIISSSLSELPSNYQLSKEDSTGLDCQSISRYVNAKDDVNLCYGCSDIFKSKGNIEHWLPLLQEENIGGSS